MFEDSVSTVPSSIWATMIGWFTPMVFFVLLNVMIGTIALSSAFNKKQNHQNQNQNQHYQNDPQSPPKLGRASSVLQRLRSINVSRYRSQEPVSHFKSAPDSDTHYSYDNAHQQESIESHTHSIFEQNRSQETETTQHNFQQNRHEKVQETHTQFDFRQNHQEKVQETHTQFDFRQNHQEKVQETHTQFYFQQNHQEKVQETHTQFDFQQNLQETQTQYHFGHAHEEKDEYIEHDFDFNQAHEEEEQEEGELQGLDEVYSELSERHISRTQSDTKPSAGEAPVKLPAKIRKSASMKSPFGHFVEADIVETRRPETTRERNTRMKEVDEEVDTKADDFINKFKQQLKLQRLDSIIRYKDMIGRGSGR